MIEPMWPSQERAVKGTLDLLEGPTRRICVVGPTGCGKSRIAAELCAWYMERIRRVVVYTNRKLLVEQLSRVLDKHEMGHGVRAAGYDDQRERRLQVSSIQTENYRVLKSKQWDLHDADLVIVDEAHIQTGDVARKIMAMHLEHHAAIIGLTATPVGIGDLYDTIVSAGTNSELRGYGALVSCLHYGPDEPDLKRIGKVALGDDLTEKQNVKAMMTPTIFARVLESYRRLNPEGKPGILFGPGVAESVWFAEQFEANGVPAAHIDGKEVWIRGQTYRRASGENDPVNRIAEMSKAGGIKMVSNRFVMREGIDWPWLEFGSLACVFGALKSFLQAGGRLLRAFLGKLRAIIADHGGNWWRHGSLNADREWSLDYTDTIVAGLREQRCREKEIREPVRCPQCGLILSRLNCICGYEVKAGEKSRPVVQLDGTLKEMSGDIFKPRRVMSQRESAAKQWEQLVLYRSGPTKKDPNRKPTFRQLEALFAQENKWQWPPHDLPLMPVEPLDWFRPVADVPKERLRA